MASAVQAPQLILPCIPHRTTIARLDRFQKRETLLMPKLLTPPSCTTCPAGPAMELIQELPAHNHARQPIEYRSAGHVFRCPKCGVTCSRIARPSDWVETSRAA